MPDAAFTADLDHVAVALERWRDGFPRFREALGGGFLSRGAAPGFAPLQLTYGDGMRVELLRPHDVERSDFLRRFLDRSGPGPHHLTFKVSDIRAAIARAEALGYPPVGVDLSMPEWQEAFIHPKAGTGVVVQLAQAAAHEDWAAAPPPPDGFPDPGPTAHLDHVAHLVADLERALEVFEGLLGGARVEVDVPLPGRRVALRWPRDRHGTVVLVEPETASPASAWLEDRPGRVHHVQFATDDPERAAERVGPHSRPLGRDRWELAPDDRTGTRLWLVPRRPSA